MVDGWLWNEILFWRALSTLEQKGESSFEGEDCKCFFKAFLERVFTVLGLFGWLIYIIYHGFNIMLIDVLKLFFVFWRNLPNSKLETQLIIWNWWYVYGGQDITLNIFISKRSEDYFNYEKSVTRTWTCNKWKWFFKFSEHTVPFTARLVLVGGCCWWCNSNSYCAHDGVFWNALKHFLPTTRTLHYTYTTLRGSTYSIVWWVHEILVTKK